MAASSNLRGSCDPRFEGVRETFAAGFASGAELGAALAVAFDGRLVVDLWGGHADAARLRPWTRDTLVMVYSTTKGITALCAHMLADRGRLDLDAPAARSWPEFAAAGKAELRSRWLLSHQAGLPAIARPLAPEALLDWATMTAALADQEPWWEPGSRGGYHPLTFGFLVGELIRRASGRSVADFVRAEIAAPLGVDFALACGPDLDARIADVIPGELELDGDDPIARALRSPESLLGRTLLNPPLLPGAQNSRAFRAAEIPAINGHTNARSLARIYAVLANGGSLGGATLLSARALREATVEQWRGDDCVTGLPGRMALGFALGLPEYPLGPNPRAFGHMGGGGSVAFADPDARLAVAYTPNRLHGGFALRVPRTVALVDAVYAAL